jgi:hypothetical protein
MWIYIAIVYCIVAMIVTGGAYQKLPPAKYYREACALFIGLIWPIPVCLMILLALETLAVAIKDAFSSDDE